MSDRAASLAGRALLALLLMIGFYVLALAIAGALVAVPALEVIYLHRLDFRIAMVCLGGAGLIVWSVLPRPDRFEPPGPRLSPAGQPRLFRVLREVAAATGQAMPVDVYLVANVNAFVTQRGGIMGAFSKRVMGLGLPLMQALTVGELRAVLAHEFGHFYGGDTKLGPWVHKTRVAIGRTIQSLRAADSSVLHLPFEWYGALFLRITHAVSRAQEYAADALAARAVGAGPLASGLKKVRGAAVAFESFWAGELHPALNGGFRPPMMQGFARFMDAAAVRRSVDAVVDQAMAHDAQDPYDTHPPLPERVSALARLPGVDPRPDDDRPAVSLLDDVDALEQALLVALTGDPSMVGRLRSAAWDALGDSLWVPQWRARRDALARARPGIAIETLPGRLDDASVLAVALWGEAAKDAPRELHRQAVARELAAALAVALIEAGWSVETAVGEPVRLHRGEDHVEPFFAVAQLFAGETSRDAWDAWIAAHGLGGLMLTPVPAAARQEGTP